MRLARDGYRELLIATVVLLGLAGAILALLGPRWYALALAAVPAVVWVWAVSFFRDPDRVPPAEPGLFVSPADGVVTDVTPIGPDSELGEPGVRIGVFMSVFNVHVNRAPCEAVVVDVAHNRGRFLDARDPQASELNESVTMRLDYPHGGRAYRVVVRQIAGMVARRIVNRAAPGQRLSRGQRIGMIKFGSRGELLLPQALAAEVRVRPGQKVFAGRSVLAAHAVQEVAHARPGA